MNSAEPQPAPRADESPTSDAKDALTFTGADKALVLGMFACGFFFFEWILNGGEPALGVSLFILLICTVTLLYFGKRGYRQSREGLLCLAVLCLSCVQFTVFDTTALQFFNLVFAALVYLYWLAVTCGVRIRGELSGCVVFDMLIQGIITPFGNIDALFRGARLSFREMKRGKEFVAAALGLLVFLPLLMIVLSLLTAADDAFSALWNEILSRIYLQDFAAYAIEFILGIPVAAYLYGAVFGDVTRRRAGILDAETLSQALARIRFVPGMAFYAPMAAFNAIYALFFVALGNYFFSAFAGRLPEALSYAEYARKGFFELCGVASLNLAIIGCVYLLMRRAGGARPAALRLMTGLMSAFTVLLIVTAMSKMLLYISSYGLTRLRVYTSWFMLLLLIVFLLLLLWHFRSFGLAKPLILVSAVCFMALTWANTDGLIAKYNIEQYLQGKTDALDVQMLYGLSDAAAPYIRAAWDSEKDLPLETAAGWDAQDPASPEAREAEALLRRLRAAADGEADPRKKTALELGILLAGRHMSALFDSGAAEYSEWSLQAARAAALYAEACREPADAFAD
ncbi:MAG: DUF4173 domain-containing protein [Clostridiales Family XIII bacterium]|jgi:hypothetical protein|nr:DUF4173 domain-containing protein [Clostridiales Family XIII bacterium]